MVSRARGTYAVLATVLMIAGILLLAIPAWSQDSQSKKDSGRGGNAKTENSSSQEKSEASNEDSNRAGDSKANKSSDQKNKASGTDKKNDNSDKKTNTASNDDPVAKDDVTVDDKNDSKFVDAGDVLTISGNYKISQDPAVTIQDEHKHKDTFDNKNATITTTNNGDLKIDVDDPTQLVATDDLTVVSSDGVNKASKNNKKHDSKKHHGHGRANKINCEQTLEQTQNQTVPSTTKKRGFLQYSNTDQIQYCIINNARRGGGGGGNNGSTNVTLEYNNDENITTQTQPEGQVLDTSAVNQLPFTGGFAPISVVASVAGIALFGAGVGVSLWQLGGRRGRSDD